MTPPQPFQWPTIAPGRAVHLALVEEVADPEGLGRVRLRLLDVDGVDGQDAPLWARVAVPAAGAARGTFFIPDVGDEVLVLFVQGDPALPVVVGSLWNGAARPPEQLPGDRVDRWSVTGAAGTRVAIVEAAAGQETIQLSTPGGCEAQLTDTGGGEVRVEVGGSRITITPTGITLETAATVSVQASQVEISAGMVTVSSALADFSGVVKCNTLIATSVVATSYTPGAGNIW